MLPIAYLAAAIIVMAALVEYPRAVPVALMVACIAFVLTLAGSQAVERKAGYEHREPDTAGIPKQYTDWEITYFRKHGYLDPIRTPTEDDLLAAERAWQRDAPKRGHSPYNIAT